MEQLKRDVESFLITARSNREKLFLQNEVCRLSDIAEEARQIVTSGHMDKNFRIEMKVLPNEFKIEVDHMYIRNVILNLICNAIKYSDESVCIMIEVNKEGKMTVLKVRDDVTQGWEINKKYRKKIFNQFYQIPVANGKRQNGYGIGLTYIQYILKQHKGTITVDSKPGVGSTFTCRIPLMKSI